MVIQDFAVIIILFIFADIVFYMVLMKGLLFTSITGLSPEDKALESQQNTPLFALELQHAPTQLVQPLYGETTTCDMPTEGSLARQQSINFTSLVSHELQNLSIENVRFSPPYDLRVGVTRHVEMVVTQNVVASVTRALNGAFPSNITSLKVSALMTASLHAKGFLVTPLTKPQQRLTSDNSLVWAWDILPTSARNTLLGFDITLNLKTASGDEDRVYSWRGGDVRVSRNSAFVIKAWGRRHWKGLSALLLLLVLYTAYAILSFYQLI